MKSRYVPVPKKPRKVKTVVAHTDSKKCKKCGEVKTLDNFYVNTYIKSGRIANCKECSRSSKVKVARLNSGLKFTIEEEYTPLEQIKYKCDNNIDFQRDFIDNRTSSHSYIAYHNFIKSKMATEFNERNFEPNSIAHKLIGIGYSELISQLDANDWGFSVGMYQISLDHVISLETAVIGGKLDAPKYESLWHHSNLVLTPTIFRDFVRFGKPIQEIELLLWLEGTDWWSGIRPPYIPKYIHDLKFDIQTYVDTD